MTDPLQRSELAWHMICAWCNVEPDKMPAVNRSHTCLATAEAWRRVEKAARDFLAIPEFNPDWDCEAVDNGPDGKCVYNEDGGYCIYCNQPYERK